MKQGERRGVRAPLELFGRMLKAPVYLVDYLPAHVPAGGRGNLAGVEAYWLEGAEYGRLWRKFLWILLKLNCYYDMDYWFGRYGTVGEAEEDWERNPDPADLERRMAECAEGNPKGFFNVVLNDFAAMAAFSGDDLYLTIYGPDAELRSLLECLAASEGLFFRLAPEDVQPAGEDG